MILFSFSSNLFLPRGSTVESAGHTDACLALRMEALSSILFVHMRHIAVRFQVRHAFLPREENLTKTLHEL